MYRTTFIWILLVQGVTYAITLEYVHDTTSLPLNHYSHYITIIAYYGHTYIQGVAHSSFFPFFSILFPLPLYFPLLTWRPPAVTNCPPSYQVSCRLTPFAPPFTQSPDPFQVPQNPNSSTPDNDDIGATPLPLCGTQPYLHCRYKHIDVHIYITTPRDTADGGKIIIYVVPFRECAFVPYFSGSLRYFFFLCMFLVNQWFIFAIFTSVAPHRGQPTAKCHLRWQPIRRLAVSCGLGRHRIRTRDYRTTVWRATIELPCLPKELPCLPKV
jgi:hypothetical protein